MAVAVDESLWVAVLVSEAVPENDLVTVLSRDGCIGWLLNTSTTKFFEDLQTQEKRCFVWPQYLLPTVTAQRAQHPGGGLDWLG